MRNFHASFDQLVRVALRIDGSGAAISSSVHLAPRARVAAHAAAKIVDGGLEHGYDLVIVDGSDMTHSVLEQLVLLLVLVDHDPQPSRGLEVPTVLGEC